MDHKFHPVIPILIFCLSCLPACHPPAGTDPPTTPSPTLSTSFTPTLDPTLVTYLENALDILQEYSYYRAAVDWEKTRAHARRLARDAQTVEEIYPVIKYVLSFDLDDRHGYLMPPEQVAQYTDADLGDSPLPEGIMIQERFAYLNIPMFASGDPAVVSAYATQLQDMIRQLDAGQPCAWVVDLRNNSGGNMWAMLAGLGPLLGEGTLGAFDYGNGVTETWVYTDGSIFEGGEEITRVTSPVYQIDAQEAPVAVLTGWDTLSSGEAVAVAFRGRPETRSFGQPTGGYATAIELFPLEDGALLGITTALFADRDGILYTGPVIPDEVVSTSIGVPVGESIEMPQAALDWLNSLPACAAP